MKHVILLGAVGASLAVIGGAPRIAAIATLTPTTPVDDLALVEETSRLPPLPVQDEDRPEPLPYPRTVWPYPRTVWPYPRTVWPYSRTVWPYPRTAWPYSDASSHFHRGAPGAGDATAPLEVPAPVVRLAAEPR